MGQVAVGTGKGQLSTPIRDIFGSLTSGLTRDLHVHGDLLCLAPASKWKGVPISKIFLYFTDKGINYASQSNLINKGINYASQSNWFFTIISLSLKDNNSEFIT